MRVVLSCDINLLLFCTIVFSCCNFLSSLVYGKSVRIRYKDACGGVKKVIMNKAGLQEMSGKSDGERMGEKSGTIFSSWHLQPVSYLFSILNC